MPKYKSMSWICTNLCVKNPLDQACQTGGPRAACGPIAYIWRPAEMFPDFEILKNAKLIAKMAPNKHFLTKSYSIETDNHGEICLQQRIMLSIPSSAAR